MKNISLLVASEQAKRLAFRLTANFGVRNAALVSKLLARILREQLADQKNMEKS